MQSIRVIQIGIGHDHALPVLRSLQNCLHSLSCWGWLSRTGRHSGTEAGCGNVQRWGCGCFPCRRRWHCQECRLPL